MRRKLSKPRTNETVCHPSNICAGSAGKCIDVVMTRNCPGSCMFCNADNILEENLADIPTLLKTVNGLTDYESVLCLGGEPLMHPQIGEFIRGIEGKKVYLTTNGYYLDDNMARELKGLTAINISIHHYSEEMNAGIFKLDIDFQSIKLAIREFKKMGIKVRFNCLLLKGGIDTFEKVLDYCAFAMRMRADEIKFAEVQHCPKLYVDAASIFHGLTDSPFENGCRTEINNLGIKTTVQQTCGLVNPAKKKVKNPTGRKGQTKVVHPDGKAANGWGGADDCHNDGCHKRSNH